jgi:hypothetical protein
MFVIISRDLPADRAAALAHDRRPPRPRHRAATAARPRAIQGSFALVFLAVALPLHHELEHGVFHSSDALLDPRRRRARLRGELLRARLAGRPQALRALRRARLHGVDLALRCSRSPSRSGSLTGSRRSRSASPPRRSSRCRRPVRVRQRRGAGARRTPPSPTRRSRARPRRASRRPPSDLSIRHGGASRSRWSGSMLAEQTLLNAGVLIVARRGGSTSGRCRVRLQRAADHARAAAALPGDPDLAPAPPRGTRGDARAAPSSRARSA